MARKGENIFRRKDGRWEARYIHHREADGKPVYRYVYARTYTEAKEKKKKAQSTPEVKTMCRSGRCESLEELAYSWLYDVKISVKESTYTRYYRTVSKYIVPALGALAPEKVNAAVINSFSERLLRDGGIVSGSLSPKTVTDILVTLKIILKFGVSRGELVAVPEGIRYPSKEKQNITVLKDSKLERLEKAVLSSSDPIALGILLALFTGLRIGEICGLRWADIDFGSETLSVERTVERISDLDPGAKNRTKVIVCEPKTKSSDRTIPLSSFLTEQLCRHYMSWRAELKSADVNECYVITGTAKACEPHSFYIGYKRWLRKRGLGDYTFHCLRHTFATRCVEAGFDTKSLSEILGHSNISTTLAIYVHPSMSQKRTQMEKLRPLSSAW